MKVAEMKLCVFPGDALKTLYEKGEIKERYYNPCNFFDEVHFITFCSEDVEPEKVGEIVGNAKIFIHALGPLKPWSFVTKRGQVEEKVKEIAPDVVRAYSPGVHGYLAACASKKNGIPFVLSLHVDPERDNRFLAWKTRQYVAWAKSVFQAVFMEDYAVRSADKVICAYDFPMQYASKHGAKNPVVIYNKVYREKFEKVVPALKLEKPGVICVGRLIPEKNQECLVRAVKDLDVKLILVGSGFQYDYLVGLAKELGIEDKVLFFKSIPNNELPAYYKSARVFALPIKMGGVAIPVIEAMASGIPVIVARPELDSAPEISSEAGLVVENTPEAFAQAIESVLDDENLYYELVEKGKRKFDEIEGKKMEEKERNAYGEVTRAMITVKDFKLGNLAQERDFRAIAKDAGFDDARIAAFLDELAKDEAFACLAYDEDGIAAFYASRRLDGMPAEKRDDRSRKRMQAATRLPELAGKNDAELTKMVADCGNSFVKEGKRGQGIGTRLYHEHETQAKRLGYSYKFEAARAPDEEGDAQRILGKLGYKHLGELGYEGKRYKKPLHGFIKKLE